MCEIYLVLIVCKIKDTEKIVEKDVIVADRQLTRISAFTLIYFKTSKKKRKKMKKTKKNQHQNI